MELVPTMQDQAAGAALDGSAAEQAKRIRVAAKAGDEAALVTELAAMVKAPQYLIEAFREMSADRVYVSHDAMLLETQDTVAVNHVLRNQTMSLAYLGVVDPQPFVQPSPRVGRQVLQPLELFAQTMELHLSRQVALMGLAAKIEGACQDASTNSYAVLKVTLQSDFMKDPIGRARFGDMQEQVAEFQRLTELNRLGQIPEGTADALRLADLEQTLRVFAAGKIEEEIQTVPVMVPGMVPAIDPMTGQAQLDPMTLQPAMMPGMVPDPTDPREMERQAIINGKAVDILGLPQLGHYQGFVCDQVLPEDFRWDWRCIRPEDMEDGDWQANRVYMSPEDVQAKWALTDDEMQATVNASTLPVSRTPARGGMASSNSTDTDPSIRVDVETQAINDTVAVWEVWHKRQFRRYVFIEGVSRLLENEVPQAVGRRFFPYFFLGYNRVSGRVVPISDVKLARNLQDEINTLRSHDREARRAAYPVLFVPRGLMDAGAQELYRSRRPFSVIEVNNADEVSKKFAEAATIAYNPSLFNTAAAESQMQQMFGLPMVVTGGSSGEDLASALALAKEGMETGVARRRIQVNRVITGIFEWMAEISLRVFPESVIQQTVGDQAIWPRLTTEELYTNLRIEIRGGLTGQPRSKDRLDLWTQFAQIAQSLQLPVNGVEVLRELLDAAGIRIDFTRFIGMPLMPPVGPAPAGKGPSRGAGPDGGAPLMVDPARGAPRSLDQVPNHPPIS